MNNEPWLQELAQAAKDEDEAERGELTPAWNRLSAGDLSAAEAEELRKLAQASPEAGEAYEAFRPLGPEFKAKTMAAVRERLAVGETSRVEARSEPSPLASAATSKPLAFASPGAVRPSSPRRPSRRWPRRAASWMAATAAVAAGLIFFLRGPSLPLPPFPAYEAGLNGGIVSHRGGGEQAPEVWTFRRGSRLDLALTPGRAVEGEIEAKCVLLRGREVRSCEANLRQPGQGTVQVLGTIGEDLRLEPGEWTLCVAVGWPGELPAGEAICAGAERTTWHRWEYRLRIEPG